MTGDACDLSVDRASVNLGGRQILDGLSLHLPSGRIFCLVGPNGSGKSTLVKLLARQMSADSGAVRLAGRPIAEGSNHGFARTVGYMPQFMPAADGMTVRELVSLGRYPWHGAFGRVGPHDTMMIETALDETGVSSFADRLVDSLSGGERQRVWLAMMIAQETRWLLLDEPTSALDIAHQVEMLDLVARLAASRGLGAVIVLHDINMAARVADEIIALRDGRIVAQGEPESVMIPETLSLIYGIDLAVIRQGSGKPLSFVA